MNSMPPPETMKVIRLEPLRRYTPSYTIGISCRCRLRQDPLNRNALVGLNANYLG
jgi:hypothetical protein